MSKYDVYGIVIVEPVASSKLIHAVVSESSTSYHPNRQLR